MLLDGLPVLRPAGARHEGATAAPVRPCASRARTEEGRQPGSLATGGGDGQGSSARRTMKATKPQLRPRRRWSSSRGHMILTLATGPKRPNSRSSTSSSTSGARLPTYLPGNAAP